MSRIGTFGASQMYLSRLQVIQTRMNKTQVQVSTELKSTAYSGIASDSNRVINLENEKARADAFVRDNNLADTKLNATTVSMTAIETTMKNFKKRLDDFSANTTKDAQNVKQMQQWAYDAMVDLQSYLAANVDGQYIFSGGRVSDEPVKLPASSLTGFQQIFDGSAVKYPTTDAFDNLAPGTRLTLGGVSPATSVTVKSVDPTTNSIKIAALNAEGPVAADLHLDVGTDTLNYTPGLTGGLTFSPQGDTITATTAGSLDTTKLVPGSAITISGSASNNGTFEILSNDGTTIKLKTTKMDFVQPTANETAASIGGVLAGAYGQLTFTSNASGALTIKASTAGALGGAGFTVGSTFSVAGATASGNDGTYKVLANAGGTTLTVTRIDGSSYTMPQGGGITLDAESWYRGDNIQLQHKVDVDRAVDLGVYASDPAFEKAFRALGLIAQGQYGTGGGLENNLERVDQARALMQDAISRNSSAPGPFGQEQIGDINSLQSRIGVTQSLIKTKNDKHKSFAGFLDSRIADLERVDKTQAVAMLLDDQTALQTSYQALATVRSLSLITYMK